MPGPPAKDPPKQKTPRGAGDEGGRSGQGPALRRPKNSFYGTAALELQKYMCVFIYVYVCMCIDNKTC